MTTKNIDDFIDVLHNLHHNQIEKLYKGHKYKN